MNRDYCEGCGQLAVVAIDPQTGKKRCDECRFEPAPVGATLIASATCSREGHLWRRTAQDWKTLRCERCKEVRSA